MSESIAVTETWNGPIDLSEESMARAVPKPMRVSVLLPAELAAEVQRQAAEQFRSPQQQCAFLIHLAMGAAGSVRVSVPQGQPQPLLPAALMPSPRPSVPDPDDGPVPVYHVGKHGEHPGCGRVAFLAAHVPKPREVLDDGFFTTLEGEMIPLGTPPVCAHCRAPVYKHTMRVGGAAPDGDGADE